jgi:hypothetical protein
VGNTDGHQRAEPLTAHGQILLALDNIPIKHDHFLVQLINYCRRSTAMKRRVTRLVVGIVAFAGLSVPVAERASAWGSKSFTCEGQSWANGSSSYSLVTASTSGTSRCPSVRVRERRANGTFGSWSYAGAGYISIGVSISAIGGTSQAFNSLDQWVGVTT